MVRRIISFSLWGDDPKYCNGIVKNCMLAFKFFPQWSVFVYFDNTVPNECLEELEWYSNVSLYEKEKGFGAFWRFEAMTPGTIVLSRDADSRLSLREKKIVDDWIKTDKKMCCIRDHANHYEFPIMAGMFGIQDGLSKEIFQSMESYTSNHSYLVDQIFLRDHVWPAYQNDCIISGIKETQWMKDSYESIGRDFIGQVYTEKDDTVYDPKI